MPLEWFLRDPSRRPKTDTISAHGWTSRRTRFGGTQLVFLRGVATGCDQRAIIYGERAPSAPYSA